MTQERLQEIKEKKQYVLSILRPLFASLNYNTEDINYEIVEDEEFLYILDTKINCTFNSERAIIDEALAWLSVNEVASYYNCEMPSVLKRRWN